MEESVLSIREMWPRGDTERQKPWALQLKWVVLTWLGASSHVPLDTSQQKIMPRSSPEASPSRRWMLCWFSLVSIIITYSLDLANCFSRAWRGIALMCRSPDVPRMVQYRPRRGGGRWDLRLVAFYYLTNEVFNNPPEKMRLFDSGSVLWPPRVAPDRGCHLRPLAAPLPSFPLFSTCEAPAELENVRNRRDFSLISYSFAWISLRSTPGFCIPNSLREACLRF